ncbi:MAG TPA: hypothetical protein VM802_27850, partial [Chitinophaga sp.]|uniref:hypothetical protein n=1 Tax=Chitinophaga sp. TaxID=1869181 RepID=UPI002CB70AB8
HKLLLSKKAIYALNERSKEAVQGGVSTMELCTGPGTRIITKCVECPVSWMAICTMPLGQVCPV